MKSLFFVCLLSFFSIKAMEEGSVSTVSHLKMLKIKDSSIHAPQRLGKISLFHDEDGFHVLQNNKPHKVKNYWVDPILRTATNKRLESFQNSGYIMVNQMDNGEFSLKANVRGLGGGPVTGSILYWITKSLCYGTAATAIGVGAATTGGAAVAIGTAVAGTAGAVVGAGAVGAMGVGVASTTLGVATGTMGAGAVVAGIAAIPGGVGVATATMATGATLAATGGCVATAVAAVETASLGAFAFGLAIPFLP